MTMARLEVRVKSLEDTQKTLRELPARMDILGQRFDALERRLEVVEAQILELRAEMRSGFSAIRDALTQTDRHMRVLHEEVISRIKAIDHG